MIVGEKEINQIFLGIAGLGLKLDAKGANLKIITPNCYEKFLKPVANPQAFLLFNQNDNNLSGEGDQLALKVKNENLSIQPKSEGLDLIFQTDNWTAKFDGHGNFILDTLQIPPKRRMIINGDFSHGEVIGDFSEWENSGFYPLLNMDMKLFVNWLARSGDVILHASGVNVDGHGYVFAGKAGAGKSTLASLLLRNHAVTVLGEDQVILRYLNGRFWIFGTPWHEDPVMCSPQGVPLEKLFFLDRDDKQGVSLIKPIESVTRILQTAFVPFYRQDLMPGILDRLEKLSKQVPGFVLSYQIGSDPWPLIIRA